MALDTAQKAQIVAKFARREKDTGSANRASYREDHASYHSFASKSERFFISLRTAKASRSAQKNDEIS